MAERARGAPGCGVPADDDESASQDERESQLSPGRKLLSQNDRGDQGNEQRHETRIERALVAGGCKAQPARRHECIRGACPGNDHDQSKPSKAIAGKASLHEDRRQEETRHAEAQRRDVPGVQAGRNGQPRDRAPARPDQYRSKAKHRPFR